jgi:chitodextrinase
LGEEEIEVGIKKWKPNKQYYIGDRVSYKGIIWRCTEDNKEAVFKANYFDKVIEEIKIKEWTSNTQFHRCDRVFHDDRIWRCIKDNTSQTDFNEDYFEEIESNIKKWETNKQYHIGDKVFYDGGIWRCIKDNTSQTDFNEDYFEKIVEEEFTFENYVDGKYDDNLKSFKFEFITFNNELNYYKTIANQEVHIVSTLTDFEVFKNDNDEFMEVHSMTDDEFYTEGKIQKQRGIHMFRHDYFNGITYAPTKKIDVHIERGSTSCFQQHIGFSEIKTLNDMVEYRNNSFFKINQG